MLLKLYIVQKLIRKFQQKVGVLCSIKSNYQYYEKIQTVKYLINVIACFTLFKAQTYENPNIHKSQVTNNVQKKSLRNMCL